MSGLFAGILYPKIVYDIKQKNQPPLSIKKRFARGGEYEQELLFTFRRSGNDFKYCIYLDVFVKRVYSGMVIKKMWITYGEKEYQILKNISLSIPESVMPLEMIDKHVNNGEWFSDGEFYFTQGIFMHPRQGSKGFPKINFRKIFGSEKMHDITFTLTYTYQFDGDIEKTMENEYDVSCFQGQYIPPFF